MEVIFHGVRGSTPTAHHDFLVYGGNTTCTEIRSTDFQFIFDAGTGFQNLKILDDRPVYLFFSHFHYDHIQGLPFNSQIFNPSNSVTISSGLVTSKELKSVFTRAFQPMYFPIPLVETLKNLSFYEFIDVQKQLNKICKIESISLHHPGGASGYFIKENNKKICIFLDHEFGQNSLVDNKMLEISKECDLVIWDGMFLNEELKDKEGWGHSSIEQAINFAENNYCKRLAIAHHAPHRSDERLKELENSLPDDKLFFASEKLVINI